jgi:hypothetical protein
MFDVTKTQQGLTGLVGIRQPLDPAYQFIDATNLASSSGHYLDDLPNFKVKYFKDTQDYVNASDAELNDLLRDIQDSAITNVLHSVFGDKSYIDRNYLYSEANTRQDQETTMQNGFVGFEICPSSKKDLAFKITNVRLEFAGTGTLKLIMFSSNLNAPIFTKDVTISSTSQVESLNWIVNNTDGGYKGKYYFGYIYDGTLIPFKRNFEYSNSINDLTHLGIDKIFKSGANDAEIFDLENLNYLSENTGLNPDITVYNDYTDLILQNDFLFARAIQLNWGIKIMQRFVSSSRSNKNERMIKNVLATLGGTTNRSEIQVEGLNELLNDEIASIKQTIKDLKEGYFGTRLTNTTMI